MAKHCDLDNTDDVKNYIANMKGANSYKDVFVKSYSYYVKHDNLKWDRPKLKSERKPPRIPTKKEIMNVVSASSRKNAVIFKILMETGVMPHELANADRREVDLDRGILSVQGFKRAHFEKFQVEKRHVSVFESVSLQSER